MRVVEPQIFLIGESRLVDNNLDSNKDSSKVLPEGCHLGIGSYLDSIGTPEWTSDAGSDSELLAEMYGRLCYRSWKPGLNPNVTKVREGNDKYLANVIKSMHGSVLEHSSVNFIFSNVSRIFTHEIVRHRAGTAISQESLRFVRLDSLGAWAPTCIKEDETALSIFNETFEALEKVQIRLAEYFKLDESGLSFDKKKEITSAMRRLAPDGLSTTIGWSANFRTLRHVIETRTNRHAEEEIRLVFDRVAHLCKSRYPNFFSDYTATNINGIGEWTTTNRKV